MKSKIYRLHGVVINIGEWDYCVEEDETGKSVILNPMPAGALTSEEEVVEGWDGGLYAANDERRLG